MNKLLKRAELWLSLFIAGTLADQYIKDGYIFKIEDVYNSMFTHEKLIVVALISLIVAGICRYRMKGVAQKSRRAGGIFTRLLP